MAGKASSHSEELEKSVEIGTLCAFYGSLLTPLQLEAVRLHYAEDLSLAEIAGLQNSTRQNIHEAITRSVSKLQDYEAKLGLMRKAEQTTAQLRQIRAYCLAGQPQQAVELADQMIQAQEGEETADGI